MADDEFARFEAELRALEAAPETAPETAPEAPPEAAPQPPPVLPPPALPRPAVRATISRAAVAVAPGPALPPDEPGFDYNAAFGYGAPYGAYPPGMPPAFRPPALSAPPAPAAPTQPPSRVEAAAAAAAALPGGRVVHVRQAAGERWVDPTLAEWPENAHTIFVGDLGKEVSDEVLTRAFSRFPGFLKARVVRVKATGEHKGFGFAAFGDAVAMAKALREQDGKYVGNRPCKLKKSTSGSRDAGLAVVTQVRTTVAPARKRKHVATLL